MSHAAPHPDIVAIGASAGGVEAVSELLERLPPDLPASVLVVVHRSVERISLLHHVLARRAGLRVVTPDSGEELRHGVCYVGNPERHLMVSPDLRVRFQPDSFYRTHNIDALFTSLARNAGPRTIGVVLSGMLKDGTLGLAAIKEAGGIALVQSPDEAVHPEMPKAALACDGSIDLVGPIRDLAAKICELVAGRRAAGI